MLDAAELRLSGGVIRGRVGPALRGDKAGKPRQNAAGCVASSFPPASNLTFSKGKLSLAWSVTSSDEPAIARFYFRLDSSKRSLAVAQDFRHHGVPCHRSQTFCRRNALSIAIFNSHSSRLPSILNIASSPIALTLIVSRFRDLVCSRDLDLRFGNRRC